MEQRGIVRWGKLALRLIAILFLLYFFICSLDLLASSFRLLSGRSAGRVFAQSELLQNPIVGVMLGVLGTVAVQSSSTTTSIIVGMVAAEILAVPQAIPMIMGANIGTSVTNTIVSITQIGNKDEFRRAFACAVVHDIFNWLSVIILLLVEVLTGFLFHLTKAIVDGIQPETGKKPPDLLKALTKPFTKKIVQLDKKVLEGWSLNKTEYANVTSLLKHCHKVVQEDAAPLTGPATTTKVSKPCGYLFEAIGHTDDTWTGIILLVASLLVLSVSLFLLVKVLNSLMRERAAGVIRKALNYDTSERHWLLGYLTGYLAMLIGAVITFCVQSSSVFTSTITPLVGIGLFPLESAYPLTLGSNIGTTTTGLLAALAADGSKIQQSLQIALCHLFFNICGTLIFYPIPFMRWPLPLAKRMGQITSEYRWFALFYLLFMFVLFPLFVFGVSLLGKAAPYIVLLPLGIILISILLINVAQEQKPEWMPKWFKDWSFMPEALRSLAPYDRLLSRLICCDRCKAGSNQEDEEDPRMPSPNNISMQTC